MTPAQRLRKIGFSASLKQRGTPLKLSSNGLTYTGLISIAEQLDGGQFTTSQETRQQAILAFAKEDFNGQTVDVGDVFTYAAEGITFRVVRVITTDFISKFFCELSDSAP